MFWDILIAVGVGVAQLAITWYAVDISVKENRIRNAIIIGLVGLAGIGLTVFGTIRNGLTQRALEGQLEKIQKNTETPPEVTVNVPQAPAPQILMERATPVRPLNHPVISVSSTKVTKDDSNHRVTVVVGLTDSSDFETTAVSHFQFLWNSSPLLPEMRSVAR